VQGLLIIGGLGGPRQNHNVYIRNPDKAPETKYSSPPSTWRGRDLRLRRERQLPEAGRVEGQGSRRLTLRLPVVRPGSKVRSTRMGRHHHAPRRDGLRGAASRTICASGRLRTADPEVPRAFQMGQVRATVMGAQTHQEGEVPEAAPYNRWRGFVPKQTPLAAFGEPKAACRPGYSYST